MARKAAPRLAAPCQVGSMGKPRPGSCI